MIIWRYKIVGREGELRDAYGWPIQVFVPGLGIIQAVYQFQSGPGDQRCAAVHLPSGRALALIEDRHTGFPQEQAQKAIREHCAGHQPTVIAAEIKRQPVINDLPSPVWIRR